VYDFQVMIARTQAVILGFFYTVDPCVAHEEAD